MTHKKAIIAIEHVADLQNRCLFVFICNGPLILTALQINVVCVQYMYV